MNVGLQGNCVKCDPIISKHESGGQIFVKKIPNTKFHENLSNGSRTDGWTAMTKLTVPFAIFCELA